MNFTVNIGDKITGRAARLVKGEVEWAIRRAMARNKVHQYAYVQGKTFTDEGTHVVTLVGPDFNITTLAELLQQDAIAVAWRKIRAYDIGWCGELFGRGYAKYSPFDINKFITMEQAMSYGSPGNPQRFVIGDKVKVKSRELKDTRLWGGVLTVKEYYEASSNSLCCENEDGICGTFMMIDLERVPDVTLADVIKRVEALESAHTAARKADAAPNDVELGLTQEEAQWLGNVLGSTCGDTGYRIYRKLLNAGFGANAKFEEAVNEAFGRV